VPPEECGGPQAFLALRQYFSIVHIAERLLAIVEQNEDVDEPQAELETLQYWLGIDRFDLRAVNRQFRQYAAKLASAEVQACA
jgi:cell division FtsZ-interacting protein ZapD